MKRKKISQIETVDSLKDWRENMIKEKKFFYKAKRCEDGMEVVGRVGNSHSTEDGKEVTTCFYEYIGDHEDNANWESCIVITDSIHPVECK